MDKNLRQFFAAAKKLNLSKSERLGVRTEVMEATNRQVESMFSGAQGIALSKKEKKQAFARIESFMEMKPAPTKESFGLSWLVPSFQWRTVPAMAVIAGLLLTSGVGVSYAAESAMPGDTLYPVKIFNEDVRDQFIFEPDKRAEWVEKRLERRFEEMQRVLSNDDLRDEWVERLQDRIEQHSRRLEERIAMVEMPEKALEIRERLEDHLSEKEEFLANLKNGDVSLVQAKDFVVKHRQRHSDRGRQTRRHFREQIESDPELRERFKAVTEEIAKQREATVPEQPEQVSVVRTAVARPLPEVIEREAIKQIIKEERVASVRRKRPNRLKNTIVFEEQQAESSTDSSALEEQIVIKKPTREEREILLKEREQRESEKSEAQEQSEISRTESRSSQSKSSESKSSESKSSESKSSQPKVELDIFQSIEPDLPKPWEERIKQSKLPVRTE